MAGIEGLIFDFGGVLWDMRWDVARELEAAHGLRERAIPETLYSPERHWREVQVGGGDLDLWRRDAHEQLEQMAARPLPPLHRHWRERQHRIEENIELIGRLRPHYRTAVLSNATLTLADQLREMGIDTLFNAVICSAEVGMAKPEPGIYGIAAQALGLEPGACVFIDDLEGNVTAAEGAGMHGIWFRIDRGDRLEEQLRALGVSDGSQIR